MTLIDKACFERGCACYDSRDKGECVEITEKREWVGLTVDELIDLERKHLSHENLTRAIEAKLKEKRVGLTGPEKALIASVSLDVHDAVHRTEAKLKEKNTCQE